MSQLKFIAVMTMFLYIFMIAFSEKNIIATLMIVYLLISYIKINVDLRHSDELSLNKLFSQREIFINYLRHDLRIPIIAQIRALELLKNEKKFGALNSQQKDIVSQTEDSCKCVLNLMNLMINTYNIENNSYKLIYEQFNISDIIISCLNEVSEQASEKNITFEYEGIKKNISIYADKEEVKKVILNILLTVISNADFSQTISINIFSVNNKIRLTVHGNKIVETKSTDTTFSSIGQSIRLGFCKKIIEIHNGKVLKNNNHNIFSFEIPKIAV